MRPLAAGLSAASVIALALTSAGNPAASVPSIAPSTTVEAASAADQPGPLIDVGLAPLELLEPATSAAGERPTFRWAPVSGASSYLLAVLTTDNQPVWAWQGTATEVILGGWDQPPAADAPGPVLGGPSHWFVVALDAEGQPLANSMLRPVTP
jgi:hypothetical protein